MATHQLNVNAGLTQPDFHRTSLLGLFFFLLGAPNLYAFLKRRESAPREIRWSRYAWIAIVGMAIAGAVELSLV